MRAVQLAILGSAGALACATGAVAGLPQGSEPVTLDPADFTTEIDNPYWPMRPGTRWIYRETDPDGGRLRVVVTVTNRTKLIANGITTVPNTTPPPMPTKRSSRSPISNA